MVFTSFGCVYHSGVHCSGQILCEPDLPKAIDFFSKAPHVCVQNDERNEGTYVGVALTPHWAPPDPPTPPPHGAQKVRGGLGSAFESERPPCTSPSGHDSPRGLLLGSKKGTISCSSQHYETRAHAQVGSIPFNIFACNCLLSSTVACTGENGTCSCCLSSTVIEPPNLYGAVPPLSFLPHYLRHRLEAALINSVH